MLSWTPTGLEPASRHPTKGPRAFRRSPAGLGLNAPPAQVEAAGSMHIIYSRTKAPNRKVGGFCSGAGDGARTRYLHLGKVALYQMSYARRTCVL